LVATNETCSLYGILGGSTVLKSQATKLPQVVSLSSITLCAEAISIALQGNQKGYGPTDLDLKLRAGYRFSAIPPEGCRIENYVLLEVLADIV
jgi:hypothetical protein